jgi:hypothetical protein
MPLLAKWLAQTQHSCTPDRKSIAMLHGEPRNDAVLIRDFR